MGPDAELAYRQAAGLRVIHPQLGATRRRYTARHQPKLGRRVGDEERRLTSRPSETAVRDDDGAAATAADDRRLVHRPRAETAGLHRERQERPSARIIEFSTGEQAKDVGTVAGEGCHPPTKSTSPPVTPLQSGTLGPERALLGGQLQAPGCIHMQRRVAASAAGNGGSEPLVVAAPPRPDTRRRTKATAVAGPEIEIQGI